MWVVFVICLISIPIFYFYDNRQISEVELVEIDNLILLNNPDYILGKRARINLNLANTDKTLVVNLEELDCIKKDEILHNLKTGDRISIKIFSIDTINFYNRSSKSKFQKIYGLKKNGQEFIALNCRNLVSKKKSMAAIYATGVSSILSLVLALFLFNPKTKYLKKGILNRDPIIIICFCWAVVMIIALFISR